jgi:hypothetical protein
LHGPSLSTPNGMFKIGVLGAVGLGLRCMSSRVANWLNEPSRKNSADVK